MHQKRCELDQNKNISLDRSIYIAPVTWASTVNQKGENTYDDLRSNRNAITTGSRVMVSGTGHTGKILSIDTEGLTAEQIRRGKNRSC